MRRWTLAVAIGLLGPSGLALAQDNPASRPPPAPPAASAKSPTASPTINADARRLEEQRQKRWDERMRRATRSLCDRC